MCVKRTISKKQKEEGALIPSGVAPTPGQESMAPVEAVEYKAPAIREYVRSMEYDESDSNGVWRCSSERFMEKKHRFVSFSSQP